MEDNNLLLYYPYNLLKVIFESDEDKIFRTYIPGFFQTLNTKITVREKNVLEYRYINRYTFKQIGEIYNVTHQRIRQIEKKAIRKLRHPSRTELYLFDVMDEAYNRGFEAGLVKGFNEGLKHDSCETLKAYTYTIKPIPIEELNLSVRTLNCLIRNGIKNTEDLLRCDIQQLMKMRNFGEKCLHELVEEAKRYGIYILDDPVEEK